jgi:RimJ/RimL family protein N-acetyltransferase
MIPSIELRDVTDADLPIIFEFQRDPASNFMADVAPRDAEAFQERWKEIRSDPATLVRIITFDGTVAGMVLSFIRNGVRELGYWIGRDYWGRGIASHAVAAFLPLDYYRPLTAHVVKDNVRSLRVVEKNGFVKTGEVTDAAWYRGGHVDLWILTLNE